ncbi:MAG: hypothetical protein O2840_00455 [bacterium]|nr:hypothetical protein [bacterium]
MLSALLTKLKKSFRIHTLVGPIRSFTFQKKKYRYFSHTYNSPHRNERTVELPIIWAEVQKYKAEDVLEIGNVLSHYFPSTHQVVDKYEVAPGVINQDIVKFKAKKKFKLIVSISTLEHVGWDEKPRSKQKILDAFRQIRTLLAPRGTAIITLPLGYNSYLDAHLQSGAVQFDQVHYLERTTAFNDWVQVSKKVLQRSPQYNYPFCNANVILIGKLFSTK